MMWTVPVRPEPAMLAEAFVQAFVGRNDPRVGCARDVAIREYSAPVMGGTVVRPMSARPARPTGVEN